MKASKVPWKDGRTSRKMEIMEPWAVATPPCGIGMVE